MDEETPINGLWRQLMGFVTTQAVGVVAELGVADLIGDSAADVVVLAGKLGVQASALHRILRLLAANGIFAEVAPNQFSHSPLSKCLRTESPDSLRNYAILIRSLVYPSAVGLLEAVKTGIPAFDQVHGVPVFDYLAADPARGRMFSKGMASSAANRSALALSYRWPESGTVVDVGGSDGAILSQILADHQQLDGIVFDRPHLAAAAEARFEAAGLSDRARFLGGDFFDSDVPKGDVLVLSAVLDAWDDATSLRILARCRDAMNHDAMLLIVDYVLPDSDDWHAGKVMDLILLIMLTGRERTLAEWRRLMSQAGFEIVNITPSPRVSLIEARRA